MFVFLTFLSVCTCLYCLTAVYFADSLELRCHIPLLYPLLSLSPDVFRIPLKYARADDSGQAVILRCRVLLGKPEVIGALVHPNERHSVFSPDRTSGCHSVIACAAGVIDPQSMRQVRDPEC